MGVSGRQRQSFSAWLQSGPMSHSRSFQIKTIVAVPRRGREGRERKVKKRCLTCTAVGGAEELPMPYPPGANIVHLSMQEYKERTRSSRLPEAGIRPRSGGPSPETVLIWVSEPTKEILKSK